MSNETGTLSVRRKALNAILIVTIVAILVMIYLSKQQSWERARNDRVALGDITLLATSFEKLFEELSGNVKGLSTEHVASSVAKHNALKFFVGPHYGWKGTSGKSRVLVRMKESGEGWVLEGTSLEGTFTTSASGAERRRAYRIKIDDRSRLPDVDYENVADAKNGKARDWNSYPVTGPNGKRHCYNQSLASPATLETKREVVLKALEARPCDSLQWTRREKR